MQVLYLMHVERVVACVHVSVHHEADKAAVVVDRKREVRSRIVQDLARRGDGV